MRDLEAVTPRGYPPATEGHGAASGQLLDLDPGRAQPTGVHLPIDHGRWCDTGERGVRGRPARALGPESSWRASGAALVACMQRRRGREAAARDEDTAGIRAEARRVVARPLERDRRHVERRGLQRQDDRAALDGERFGHLED